jgi:hypothetical protein
VLAVPPRALASRCTAQASPRRTGARSPGGRALALGPLGVGEGRAGARIAGAPVPGQPRPGGGRPSRPPWERWPRGAGGGRSVHRHPGREAGHVAARRHWGREESSGLEENLLWSCEQVGHGAKMLTDCARFYAATNSDKLSGAVMSRLLCTTTSTATQGPPRGTWTHDSDILGWSLTGRTWCGGWQPWRISRSAPAQLRPW